jgi:hypothetical protein
MMRSITVYYRVYSNIKKQPINNASVWPRPSEREDVKVDQLD